LRAALQTDRAPEGPDTPEGLRALLARREKAPLPPNVTVAEWLASLYKAGAPEFQERLRSSLIELLEAPETFGLGGESLALALELAEAARISEAVSPIRRLVATRKLYALSDDDCSDLHGLALRALLLLGELDPVACFEQELPYRDYVPLAFAFVRDRAKDRLPEILPQIATLDFFPDALRTVVRTYSEDHEYMDLLRQTVRNTLAMDDQPRAAALADAIQRLPTLQATEVEELLQKLYPVKRPMVEVLVKLEDKDTDDTVIESLLGSGFEAKQFTVNDWRQANAPWLLTTSSHLHSFVQSSAPHGNAGKLLRVFRQGDAEPLNSKDELSIVIPRSVETTERKADLIRQRLVRLRLQQHRVEAPSSPGSEDLQGRLPRAAPPKAIDLLNSARPRSD
jgi:hypothetical protein